MKIAVVGSGISGLTAAFLLDKKHDVTVFEKNDWVGGHAHTVQIEAPEKSLTIDTGFMVCNRINYPYFFKLLNKLQVDVQKTDMSFSVTLEALGVQYNGHNLNTLFSQRKNLFSKAFWSMISGILKFNRAAKLFLRQPNETLSLDRFLASHEIPEVTIQWYLLPMIGAIWSCDLQTIASIPAYFVIHFLHNHGLLKLINRPQWYTIVGGSHTYIKKLCAQLKREVQTNTPIVHIERQDNRIILATKNNTQVYDKVILATHGNEAIKLIATPTQEESKSFSQLTCQKNEVVLHTNDDLIPKNMLSRASWNVFVPKENNTQLKVSYYMNRLQNLNAKKNYIVSLNQTTRIKPESIIAQYEYSHPVFTLDSIKAQKQIALLNGKNNTYYCGAYLKNGFHEDGVRSAIDVVRMIDEDCLCKASFM